MADVKATTTPIYRGLCQVEELKDTVHGPLNHILQFLEGPTVVLRRASHGIADVVSGTDQLGKDTDTV